MMKGHLGARASKEFATGFWFHTWNSETKGTIIETEISIPFSGKQSHSLYVAVYMAKIKTKYISYPYPKR